VLHAEMQDVPLHAVFEFEGQAIGFAHGGDLALDEGLGGAASLRRGFVSIRESVASDSR
jgi:hypothetical protein